MLQLDGSTVHRVCDIKCASLATVTCVCVCDISAAALWIDPATPLGPASGNYPMLLGRRLFSTCIEEDLDLYEHTPFLADMLYHQVCVCKVVYGHPFCLYTSFELFQKEIVYTL